MEKPANETRSCFGGCLRFLGSAIGLAILAFVLVVGGYLALRASGAYLIVADEPQPASAIVIMGGGNESRMGEALELYRDRLSNMIILTETGEYIDEFDYLQSFDLRIQLLNYGVPAGNILITEGDVTSTWEEAQAVRDLMQARQMTSAIIITDPYHTKRTRIIFNDVFADSDITLFIHPVRPSWYNSREWFLSRDGWKFTVLEYVKLFAYKFGFYD